MIRSINPKRKPKDVEDEIKDKLRKITRINVKIPKIHAKTFSFFKIHTTIKNKPTINVKVAPIVSKLYRIISMLSTLFTS